MHPPLRPGTEGRRTYPAPPYPEVEPRPRWSLSNAFTVSFKLLEPGRQMEATASLHPFLAQFN